MMFQEKEERPKFILPNIVAKQHNLDAAPALGKNCVAPTPFLWLHIAKSHMYCIYYA
jgi:hypothetical protein